MKQTITHCLIDALKRPESQIAVTFKSGSHWLKWSWLDFYRQVEALAGYLSQIGVQPGDQIAIYSSTRVEWFISDMAIMALGAITIPIYTSNREEDIEYILNSSECSMIIIEQPELLDRFLNVANNCPKVKSVLFFNKCSSEEEKVVSWKEAIISGRKYAQEKTDFLIAAIYKNTLDQTATVVYTSGATGKPKGVVLTHKQIMSEISDIFDLIGIDHHDRSLTFLPYAHILGRIESWGSLYTGFTLCFAESLEKLQKNLQEVKPTTLIGVPRVFEKIYNSICTQVEAHPVRHHIFDWAVSTGQKVSQHRLNKEPLPTVDLAQYMLAKKLIFSPLKKELGGRLRFAISGGAPLSREIAEFFHSASILILEGYGLTETTAAVTLNTPLSYCFGTVGKPIGDVDIKIASDGEIIVKSDKVMKEYYHNLDSTKKAFTRDGYFKTGDIGEFTDDGFLRITDRKKNLIKTAGGKYVAPQKLENLLKLNKYISHALIHGDRRKYIVALLTLNFPAIEEFAQQHNISYINTRSLTQHPKIKELIRDNVAEINCKLLSFETIKNFAVLPDDFTIESGELTPSLKIRRKFCDKKYKKTLDRLYGVDSNIL